MNRSKPLMLTIKHLDKEWQKYLRKLSAQIGMPEAYRHIIMFLSRNPGASQKQVAEFCQMTGAAISQTIKEMQLAGYVQREVDEADQRYYKLYLTEKSHANVDIIRQKIHEADDFITTAISPEKEAEIVEILKSLADTIRKEL